MFIVQNYFMLTQTPWDVVYVFGLPREDSIRTCLLLDLDTKLPNMESNQWAGHLITRAPKV